MEMIRASFRELELEGEDELLRNVKSYHYHKTDNYHKLLDFIEKTVFEVFIVGHSCGLSDKTMLNTIFEHKNCMAIKNYHYGENGVEQDLHKGIAISRHFSNKGDFRDIRLAFDERAHMPTIKNQ